MNRPGYLKDVPVIFLTADDDSETETKALAAGAMDFVKKPFSPSVLLMRVQNTIKLMRLQIRPAKLIRLIKKPAKRLSV